MATLPNPGGQSPKGPGDPSGPLKPPPISLPATGDPLEEAEAESQAESEEYA